MSGVRLEGVRGIVADSKAYSRRTLGLCLEHEIGLSHVSAAHVCDPAGTRGLGAAATRLAPVGGETRADEGTRRRAAGMGKASSARSRSSIATDGSLWRRCGLSSSIRVNWRSSKPQTYAVAQAKEAEAVAEHVKRVHARWFACAA